MLSENGKYVWSSGEICEIAGTYIARCCNTHVELNYIPGDNFVRCPVCRKKIKWERKHGNKQF